MITKKQLIFTIISVFLSISIGFTHSGRTDSAGCHNCRTGQCAGTYHCHNGGSYNYRTNVSTQTCPANSYSLGSKGCACNDGYCPLMSTNTCYKKPENSYCVSGDPYNARRCVSGYKEIGKTCIKNEHETQQQTMNGTIIKESLVSEKKSINAPKNFDYFETDKNKHCDANYYGTIYDDKTGYCICQNRKVRDGTCYIPSKDVEKIIDDILDSIDDMMLLYSAQKRKNIKRSASELLKKYEDNEELYYIVNYIKNWKPKASDLLDPLF